VPVGKVTVGLAGTASTACLCMTASRYTPAPTMKDSKKSTPTALTLLLFRLSFVLRENMSHVHPKKSYSFVVKYSTHYGSCPIIVVFLSKTDGANKAA
jgi:L-asparagine transporter-like permease